MTILSTPWQFVEKHVSYESVFLTITSKLFVIAGFNPSNILYT
jgi:hypothetical protein